MSSSPPLAPLATNIVTLLYVEVIPLRFVGNNSSDSSCCLTSPLVKLHLQQQTCPLANANRKLRVQWEACSDEKNLDRSDATAQQHRLTKIPTRGYFVSKQTVHSKPNWAIIGESRRVVSLVYMQSSQPTELELCPCAIVGYGFVPNHHRGADAAVSDATLVRVQPVQDAIPMGPGLDGLDRSVHLGKRLSLSSSWKERSVGALCDTPVSNELQQDVLANHDDETISALTLRMQMLLSRTASIGTTVDALVEEAKRRQRKHRIQREVKDFTENNMMGKSDGDGHQSAPHPYPCEVAEGALLVHSPHHGAGKTLLVKTIAQKFLKCGAIHVIRPGAILAKYGIHADTALETQLHGLCISAACQSRSICIVLDQLDAMVPASYSGRLDAGDAALPVLNGIAAYLKSLAISLQRRHEFPFPTKNELYNWSGRRGPVLQLRLCLVGIVTCSDDGGTSTHANSRYRPTECVLDVLGGGRFRVPDLSPEGRLCAFEAAFRRANIVLSNEARAMLPVLAASNALVYGNIFSRVAAKLLKQSHDGTAIVCSQLQRAMDSVNSMRSGSTKLEFSPLGAEPQAPEMADGLGSVGGNVEAKAAVEEALALDPNKRALLARFGMLPPTGVLLYGPPGNGKTLIARAVSRLLKAKVGKIGSIDGAFISLKASDLVRSEVGASEKLLVSSFETARLYSPSVCFIDEFEALFTERRASGNGKLASVLLQCMDDLSRSKDADARANLNRWSDSSSRIIVMGATNVPWMIDKAFLRPRRFDRVIYVGLPCLAERVSILTVHISLMRLRIVQDRRHEVTQICAALASSCEGWSGADLVALCRAAAVRCLDDQGESGRVNLQHFLDARKYDVSASSNQDLTNKLAAWKP